MITLEQCRGCEDDFYNGNNPLGIQRCWSAATGEIVKRYAIGTWTMPASPGAFTEVEVPNCYRRKGEHYYRELPYFVKQSDVRRRNDEVKP